MFFSVLFEKPCYTLPYIHEYVCGAGRAKQIFREKKQTSQHALQWLLLIKTDGAVQVENCEQVQQAVTSLF